MKRYVKYILFMLLCTSTSTAQYVGLSSYAAMSPNFPCDKFLAIQSCAKYPAMTVLWGAFGNDTTCIQRFLTTFKDRPHLLEVHFSNESGRFTGLGPDFLPWMSVRDYNWNLENWNNVAYQAIEDRLTEIINLYSTYGTLNTQSMLSTGLEDRFTSQAHFNLAYFIKRRWPWLLVRSTVLPDRSIIPGEFVERHGSKYSCTGGFWVLNQDSSTNPSKTTNTQFLRRNTPNLCLGLFFWNSKHQGRIGSYKRLPLTGRTFIIPDGDVPYYCNLLRRTGP